MKKKTINYKEGDLFLIETESSNKFLGLIIRRKGRTKLLLGGFWKLDFEITENILLDKKNVLLIGMFSGLGFEIGNWEKLGAYKFWNNKEWLFPQLKRYDPINNIYFVDDYNDSFEVISQKKISEEEAENLYRNTVFGYLSLENHLDRIIDSAR